MINTVRIDLPPNTRGERPFLHCRVAGTPGAPLLLFLHGFPEGPFIWDGLMARLAATHRCVAPALRGYPGSYTPADVKAYRAHEVVGDLVALIRQEASTPDTPAAAVIGHDWGGAIAWTLASMAPTALARLMILNAPHTATFLRDLRDDPAQQAASAYMNDLRAPKAEAVLSANDFAALWALVQRFGSAQGLTPEARDAWRAQLRTQWSGHPLTGALNYYRASPLYPPAQADDAVHRLALPDAAVHVSVPTTVLWGEADEALRLSLLDGLGAHVPDLRVRRLPGVSHWVVHEAVDTVDDELRALLAR